jgi:CubicO group peptidase (beta-lactamase class C family)
MPIRVRHLATHTSGITDRKAAYEKVYLKGPQDSTTLEPFLKAYFIKGGRYYSDKNFSKYQPGGTFNTVI